MALIKNGEIVEDNWVTLGAEDSLPAGPAIVPMARFLKERENLLARGAPLGILIASDESPEDLSGDLDKIDLIALDFPKFRDGRAYSSARLLRERFGFKGELRAVGEVLRDQFLFMHRVGFDAFVTKKDSDVGAWRRALAEISVFYQPAVDSVRTVFELRRGRYSEMAAAE